MLDRAGKIGVHYPPSAYKPVMLVYFIISLLSLIAIFFSKETIRKRYSPSGLLPETLTVP